MTRLLLLGLTLALSTQVYGQMSTINGWQENAKYYTEVAAFFASAQVSSDKSKLYFDPKEKEKLDTVYERKDSRGFLIDNNPPLIIKSSTAEVLFPLFRYPGIYDKVSYSYCQSKEGEYKLCLNKEYISLFKKTVEFYIHLAQGDQNLYASAVRILGSRDEQKLFFAKKEEAERQLTELLKKQDEIKQQGEKILDSRRKYDAIGFAAAFILFLVMVTAGFPASLPGTISLVSILLGTMGFSLFKVDALKTSYNKLMDQNRNVSRLAQEKQSEISNQEGFISIISKAAIERKNNPSLQLKP